MEAPRAEPYIGDAVAVLRVDVGLHLEHKPGNRLFFGQHGARALGVDRWAMMLAGTSNIRDVIAFPKNQRARDLMTGAPAAVDAKQLKELGIKL